MPAFEKDPNNEFGSTVSYAYGDDRRKKGGGFNKRRKGKGYPKGAPALNRTSRPAATDKSREASIDRDKAKSAAAATGPGTYKTSAGQVPPQHKLSYWLKRLPKDAKNRKNRAYALQKRAKAATDREGNVDMSKVTPGKYKKK